MLIKRAPEHGMREQDVTPEGLYLDRRQLMAGLAAFPFFGGDTPPPLKLSALKSSPRVSYAGREPLTPFEAVTGYNNYYEFGLDKEDPAKHAHKLVTKPWTVKVDGLCAKPGTYDLDDVINFKALEERIYRLRCVEAWSMVIPWVGEPLANVLARFEPSPKAKYVAFETVVQKKNMPGLDDIAIDWPYREGLRMDEAMHPLAMLAVGLYGRTLANQNGAPLRLVVPWKYGFKNIKSIVRISFVERKPQSTWNMLAPSEYGFYANVNPAVDHPRWSQASERRIGDLARRPTLGFNGYGAEVAGLYKGMNLWRDY